jgi:hypothetical protein
VKVLSAPRRFVALSPPERRLALRALGIVVRVRVRLTVSSFPTVDRLTKERPIRETVGPHSAARIGSTVAAVSGYVPGASCLTQALATRALLAEEGHASTLRLGMARIDGRLQAHAWLESDGTIVVGGTGHRQFVPFESAAPSPNR